MTGVDQTHPDLGAVTPSQITKGTYFTGTGAYQAILSSSYASTNKLAVGSTITLGGHAFRVIGIASSPLGGTPSDAYVKLATLQKLAKYGHRSTRWRCGRRARATSRWSRTRSRPASRARR